MRHRALSNCVYKPSKTLRTSKATTSLISHGKGLQIVAASASDVSGGVAPGADTEEDATACMPAFVTGNCSVVHLSVVDYPGLLRSVSWVLNGLGLKVVKAQINTTDDGMVGYRCLRNRT